MDWRAISSCIENCIVPPKGDKDMNVFVCYEKCTTCQKAMKWLKDNDVEFSIRPIKEQNPSRNELAEWIDRSGLEFTRFFNTSGQLYRGMGLKDKVKTMTKEEAIALLSTDGMLVKRPILVSQDNVLVGFKEEEWKTKLLG